MHSDLNCSHDICNADFAIFFLFEHWQISRKRNETRGTRKTKAKQNKSKKSLENHSKGRTTETKKKNTMRRKRWWYTWAATHVKSVFCKVMQACHYQSSFSLLCVVGRSDPTIWSTITWILSQSIRKSCKTHQICEICSSGHVQKACTVSLTNKDCNYRQWRTPDSSTKDVHLFWISVCFFQPCVHCVSPKTAFSCIVTFSTQATRS